jgi:uncharacterized membrane protein YphA (DoxX/SURF4 family)
MLIRVQGLMDWVVANFQFLASLALRAYLVPVFWLAGMNKVNNFDDIVVWFGNSEWGLGLPFPELMAFLATSAEVGGAVLLALGLGVRYASIPLMITMLVAAFSVHWQNGWQSVADLMSPWANENAPLAIERLNELKATLREAGTYDYFTEYGGIIVSNNGIEWAATYFVMLLALFFLGGGKYVSADYWIRRRFMP